jgi:hypothetical protein
VKAAFSYHSLRRRSRGVEGLDWSAEVSMITAERMLELKSAGSSAEHAYVVIKRRTNLSSFIQAIGMLPRERCSTARRWF